LSLRLRTTQWRRMGSQLSTTTDSSILVQWHPITRHNNRRNLANNNSIRIPDIIKLSSLLFNRNNSEEFPHSSSEWVLRLSTSTSFLASRGRLAAIRPTRELSNLRVKTLQQIKAVLTHSNPLSNLRSVMESETKGTLPNNLLLLINTSELLRILLPLSLSLVL